MKAPALWQGIQFTQAPFKFLDHCFKRYGENFQVTLGRYPGRCHLVSSPEMIREVFQQPSSFLGYHPLAQGIFGYLPQSSVILSQAEMHAERKRNLISLLQAAARRNFDQEIGEIVSSVLGQGGKLTLRKSIEAIVSRVVFLHVFGSSLGERDFDWLFQTATKERLAMSVYAPSFISRFAFGVRDPSLKNRNYECVVQFLKRKYSRGGWDEKSVIGDLAARDLDGETLAYSALEVLAFLFGTLTVSGLHGAYAYLKHKSAREFINSAPAQAEVGMRCPFSKVSSKNSAEKEGTVPTNRVSEFFREVWRLYPDVPLTFRCAYRSGTIANLDVNNGDIIVPCIYLAHRNERFFENAHAFRPDRAPKERGNGAGYMPGGGGVRKCPGINFASKVMADIFSRLFTAYSIEPSGSPRPLTRLTTGMQAYRTDNLYATVRQRIE